MKNAYRRLAVTILAFGALLGSYRGYLALWDGNTSVPHTVFPYPISALPQQDQVHLSYGIHLQSDVDLEKMLEDYLS